MITLGFHYHIPAIQKADGIYMPGFLGLFIDSLAPQFTKIVCFMHTPAPHETGMMDYRLKAGNIILRPIGQRSSIPKRVLGAILHGKGMFTSPVPLDVFLVRASTPLLPFIYRQYQDKTCLLLVSDAVEGLDNLNQPAWRLALIKIWANWYQRNEDRIATKVLTFVNSDKLYKKLKSSVSQLYLTKTTTLRENDFLEREDTCQGDTIEFMYAGRITKTKGILDILDALSRIKAEGWNLRFNLVGMVDKSDPIIDQVREKARRLQMEDDVVFHGYKPAGDELLAYYRRADVFVIASQGSSEGFPRTIWEAMASSVPVVASRVSSIPGYIGHCAEIVEPLDIDDLYRGIREILSNPVKRKANIASGLALARTNTLEHRAAEMATIIKGQLQK